MPSSGRRHSSLLHPSQVMRCKDVSTTAHVSEPARVIESEELNERKRPMSSLNLYYPILMHIDATMPLPGGVDALACGLPGFVLRKAFEALVGEPGSAGEDDTRAKREAEWKLLVTDRRLRFLFAHPVGRSVGVPGGERKTSGAEERTLPIPASVVMPEAAEVSGREGTLWRARHDSAAGEGTIAAYGLLPEADGTTHVSIARPIACVRVPGSREADSERFGLADGQTLVGMIQVTGDDEAECRTLVAKVRDRLKSGYVAIGEWHRPGQFGVASFNIGRQQPRESSLLTFQNGRLGAGTRFGVLLSSPCLSKGESIEALVARALESALGHGAASFVSLRTGALAGWTGDDSVGVVAPGTMLVFEATRQLEDHDLLRFEHAGIGGRLEDGFGRVLLTPEPVGNIDVVEPPRRDAISQPEGEPPAAVLQMQARLLEDALEGAIASRCRELTRGAHQVPYATVLRLRSILRGDPGPVIAMLREWISGTKEDPALLRREALDALGECNLGGRSVLGVVRALVEGGQRERFQRAATELGLEQVVRRVNLAGSKSALNYYRAMGDVVTVRLLDGLLAALGSVPPSETRSQRPRTRIVKSGGPGRPKRQGARRGSRRGRGRPRDGAPRGGEAKGTE